MVQSVLIFSKSDGEVLVSTSYDNFNPDDDSFLNSINKIREISTQLEKGVFKLDLDGNLQAQIFAVKRISVVFIFSSKESEIKANWENVAKEIASTFDKDLETYLSEENKRIEFKVKMNEIIEWHKKELSPIDKMKDALW